MPILATVPEAIHLEYGWEMRSTHLQCLVAVVGLASFTSAQTTLSVTGLPPDVPFSISASATDRQLTLDFVVEAGWHLYSRDVGGGQPIAVDVGGDFRAVGALVAPEDPRGHVTGLARLTLPIEIAASGASGPFELSAKVMLQVCDELECLVPMTVTLEGDVDALRVLLVVAEKDEHAARIETWLGGRGFATTVTTYTDVTAAMCDGSDVVLADSKTFRSAGVKRAVINAFPKTEAPLITVGFNGTRLVEAHGLAMTSGYI